MILNNIGILEFIKIKKYFCLKTWFRWMKSNLMLAENIYKNILDEGQEFKVCKGLLKFRQESIHSTINKWPKISTLPKKIQRWKISKKKESLYRSPQGNRKAQCYSCWDDLTQNNWWEQFLVSTSTRFSRSPGAAGYIFVLYLLYLCLGVFIFTFWGF